MYSDLRLTIVGSIYYKIFIIITYKHAAFIYECNFNKYKEKFVKINRINSFVFYENYLLISYLIAF